MGNKKHQCQTNQAETLTTIDTKEGYPRMAFPMDTAESTASYNADGQVTGTSVVFGSSSTSNSYSYDNDSQLTALSGSSDNSYSYDVNGNRNSTGFSTGAGNEMTHSPGVTYTYDNNGNMITATDGSGTTTYTYDYENRLTNVEIDGTMAATYTYDALGRRIGIDDSGTQTWTVFNGKSADANPYADFNSSGNLKMRYLDAWRSTRYWPAPTPAAIRRGTSPTRSAPLSRSPAPRQALRMRSSTIRLAMS